MAKISKIQLPSSNEYNLNDLKAVHYLGITTTELEDNVTTNPILILNNDGETTTSIAAIERDYVMRRNNSKFYIYISGHWKYAGGGTGGSTPDRYGVALNKEIDNSSVYVELYDQNNTELDYISLGTAANYNVPISGNAGNGEVVLGSDTRLTTKYIPLTGTGTDNKNNNVTGSVIFGYNDNGNITGANGIKYYSGMASSYVSVIRWSWGPNWYEYTDTQHSNTPYNGCPQIGYYNGGGTDTSATTDDGSITILPYVLPSNGALPWDGTVGLHIKKNHAFIDGSEIITEAGDHLYKSNNTIMLNPRCKNVSNYASGNYNYLLNNGFYMSTGSGNAPTTGSGSWEWWMGSVLSHDDDYVIQDMWQFTAGTDPTTMPHKMRIKCNGIWGNWTDVHLTDTTYSVSTGDSNGQIKITPSSGTAYNVNVKGLGSAAYTASTDYLSASGTAAAASKLSNTSKIGDTNKPVYFTASGVPSAISYTINKSVPSSAVFTDENVSQSESTSTNFRGVLLSDYASTSTTATLQGSSPSATYYSSKLRVKPSTGDLYINSNKVAVEGVTTYAGSSTSGGSATTAEALTSTSIGNSSKPVYFNSSGKPVAISNTLGSAAYASTSDFASSSSHYETYINSWTYPANSSSQPNQIKKYPVCSYYGSSTGDDDVYSSTAFAFATRQVSATKYARLYLGDENVSLGELCFHRHNNTGWIRLYAASGDGEYSLILPRTNGTLAISSSKSYSAGDEGELTKGRALDNEENNTKGSSSILITDDNDKDHIIQGMTIRESAVTLKILFKDEQSKQPLYSIAEIPYFSETSYTAAASIQMYEYDEKAGIYKTISTIITISIEYDKETQTITLTVSPQDDSIKLPYIQTVYECD